MTSAIFQSDEKEEVPSEQLIISVIGPSITCRASLNTLALVLSGPGALFGKYVTTLTVYPVGSGKYYNDISSKSLRSKVKSI